MKKHAYYESKWKADDLDGKTVEFLLRTSYGAFQGLGKFRIHVSNHLIAVSICRQVSPQSEEVLSLWNPGLADKIEVHPDKAVAEFRLME